MTKTHHRHLEQALAILAELAQQAGIVAPRLEVTDSLPGGGALPTTPACSSSYLRTIYVRPMALDTLDQGETVIRGIFAHELGHIVLKHFYWDSVFGEALLWGAIPSFGILWWATGSGLLAAAVVVGVIILRLMLVQRAAIIAENYREEAPHERAADRWAEKLIGEANWRLYQDAMNPRRAVRQSNGQEVTR